MHCEDGPPVWPAGRLINLIHRVLHGQIVLCTVLMHEVWNVNLITRMTVVVLQTIPVGPYPAPCENPFGTPCGGKSTQVVSGTIQERLTTALGDIGGNTWT